MPFEEAWGGRYNCKFTKPFIHFTKHTILPAEATTYNSHIRGRTVRPEPLRLVTAYVKESNLTELEQEYEIESDTRAQKIISGLCFNIFFNGFFR